MPCAAAPEPKALLDAGRYAELGDQCRETLGRTLLFTALLRKGLARPVTPPETTHRPIVQPPYAAIVTTNFDTLLAGLPVSQALFRARSSVRAPKDNTPLIFAREGYADVRLTPDS